MNKIVLVDKPTGQETELMRPVRDRSTAWYNNTARVLADTHIGPYAWRMDKGHPYDLIKSLDGQVEIKIVEILDAV